MRLNGALCEVCIEMNERDFIDVRKVDAVTSGGSIGNGANFLNETRGWTEIFIDNI